MIVSRKGWGAVVALMIGVLAAADASAGWPRRARGRVVATAASSAAPAPVYVTTSAPVVVTPTALSVVSAQRRATGLAPSPMLGTFYPDNYVNIRGNFEAGGGYSPLGTYGDTTADLYGPLSSFRQAAAPVVIYQRGYNGAYQPALGTGFSTPNFPTASPVVYPTRANAVGAPRRVGSPVQWDRANYWLDMN